MLLTTQFPTSTDVAMVPKPEQASVGGSALDDLEARREAARVLREQRLDDKLAQSFPASDSPSWVLGTTPACR